MGGSGAGAFVHTADYVVVYFLYDIRDTQPTARQIYIYPK